MSTTRPDEASARSTLVAGSTGLIGRHLVPILAAEPDVSSVALPVRRMPDEGLFGASTPRDKLSPFVVDFGRLEEHSERFRASQIFVCLGTTIADAGSQEAFRKVDHDYVIGVARCGARGGARDLLVITALGADPDSRVFYNRVKGEVEEHVAALPYRSVTFFRPSLLLGARDRTRTGERIGAAVGSLLRPFLIGRLARYRPVPAPDVARAMAVVARAPRSGVRVVESEEIARLARAR